MTQYTLSYFDIDGGRGEPIRLAFHLTGIPLQDKRISFEAFFANKAEFPFGVIPSLDIEGDTVSQSNAMLRFVGKKAGLYPDDDMQALYCDEVLDVLEDMTHHVVRTMGLEGEVLKQARQELMDGKLRTYLAGLEKLLVRGGGQFFAGGALSIADLKCFVQMRSLSSVNLDHIPADFARSVAPQLHQHQLRIADTPQIQDYYNARQR